MSDLFDNITTRLDIRKSSVDSSVDKVRSKSRAIKKIRYDISIPALTIDNTAIGAFQFGQLVAQKNYTAPQNFRILDIDYVPGVEITEWAFVCIKWRTGSTVYRYRLPFSWSDAEALINAPSYTSKRIQAQRYEQEVIAANFTIEYWTQTDASELLIIPDITLLTNLLLLPDTVNSSNTVLQPTIMLAQADLALALDDTLPSIYGDNSSWLTN